MPKFNLENYETVEDRLKVFWKENPNGCITTDVVHITDDGSCVTIKAYIQDNNGNLVATGIAQETKGQGGFANTDAWVENCETSAIGRGLANWKYQGSKSPRPSREEMSKVQVEKKPAYKPTKEEEVAMNKVADEMVAEPKSDVPGQINTLLTAMITDEEVRKTIKKKAYDELVNNGIASPDVKMWSKSNIDTFMTRAEDMFKKSSEVSDKELVEEVFGEVAEIKVCPECNDSNYIEDNREKKESDPKYSKIPDFACSNYGDNKGCGKGWYIGNEDFPTGWI